MNKIKILGYEIMDIDYKKLFQEIECLLQKKRFFYFVTLNPEIVVVAREAQELADYIKKAQMILKQTTPTFSKSLRPLLLPLDRVKPWQ